MKMTTKRGAWTSLTMERYSMIEDCWAWVGSMRWSLWTAPLDSDQQTWWGGFNIGFMRDGDRNGQDTSKSKNEGWGTGWILEKGVEIPIRLKTMRSKKYRLPTSFIFNAYTPIWGVWGSKKDELQITVWKGSYALTGITELWEGPIPSVLLPTGSFHFAIVEKQNLNDV